MPETFSETQDVAHNSYLDYVATVRDSCHPDVFEWPAKSRTFDDTIAAALEACPPGCMVVVRNAKDPPEDWYDRTRIDTRFEATEEIKQKLRDYQNWLDWKVRPDMSQGESYRLYPELPQHKFYNEDDWFTTYQQPQGSYRRQGWDELYAWRFNLENEQWESNKGPQNEEDPRHYQKIVLEYKEGISTYFHGSSTTAVPGIVANGLKPTIGASTDTIRQKHPLQSTLPRRGPRQRRTPCC